MDSRSLVNVLGILRLLKGAPRNESAFSQIAKWVGKNPTDLEMLKIAGYIVEQASLAHVVIENSQLSVEAKAGMLSTIRSVQSAFSLKNGHGQWSQHIKDVQAAISNLVIFTSAMGIDDKIDIPDDAKGLIDQIDEMIRSFEDEELDPAVRDIAKRHMSVLATLLRHIPIFGIEAAMTSYFELVIKLQRTEAASSADSHKKLKPLFEKIKGWGENLTSIDKAMNAGVRIGQNSGKVMDVLQYLPSTL